MKPLFRAADPGTPSGPIDNEQSRGWSKLSGTTKILIVAVGLATPLALLAYNDFTLTQSHQHVEAPVPQQAANTTPDTPPPRATSPLQSAPKVGVEAAKPVMVPMEEAPSDIALYSAGDAAIQALKRTVEDMQARAQGKDHSNGDSEPETYHASILHNPNFVIREGETIPCSMVNALDSSRPGIVVCRIDTWFNSSDQARGLMPPKSKIIGHFDTGISNNQMRLGVVFDLIETPWFDMKLKSPGGDAMGRSGIDGNKKTFFWEKAGSVGVYALMDAGIGIAQNGASQALNRSFSGGGGGTYLNLQGPAENLASQEMQQQTERQPVLTLPQGYPLTVTLGQNLDFTGACSEAMQVDPMACPLR